MSVATDVPAIAVSKLGDAEDPPGSNHNDITEFYADLSGQEWARRGNPWCMMFVTWVLQQLGVSWFVYAYCPYVERDARNGVNGMSFGSTPEVGTVVLYDLEGAGMATHTGFVDEVLDDGTFMTTEGNWGNKVTNLHRDMKYVRGFVSIPFDGSPSSPLQPSGDHQSKIGDFPLPSGHWFGPPSKNSRQHSGYFSASDSDGVQKLQQALNDYCHQNLRVDGRFGNKDGTPGATGQAVVNVERFFNLDVDSGLAGEQVWGLLSYLSALS